MKQLGLGSLLAAVAMFVWGAIFWMSPLPYSALERTSDDAATGKSLLDHFPKSGTYLLPGQYNDQKALAALTQAGPVATVHLQREGQAVMPPSVFIFGFVHEFLTVFLIALLIKMALPALGSYRSRVGFVALAGLAAAFFTNAGNPIWWHHPWPWCLFTGIYDVTAWLVAGLVLAAFIKPKPAAA